MPLSEENQALVERATNPIRLRWWMNHSGHVTELNDLLDAVRAEERAAAKTALETAAEDLHRIMRTAEMSSGIMLDPQRTGNWPGARKTADAFDRIGLRAAEAKAKVRAVIAS